MDREEQLNLLAAILASGHIVNTSYEERFRETVEIFLKYRTELAKEL